MRSEEQIIEYWKKERILEAVREKNKYGKVFYFLDGPPYVTGDLHPGHIWVKSLKDLFVRYKRYRGFNVIDRAGYDVHGLPIENKVEKELGITSKKEIEARIGVESFVKECRSYVERYVNRIDSDYERYGISLNFKDPYLPYTNEYIISAWGLFKAASDRNFLYEGKKTLIYCPHCGTPLSQGSMEVEYKDDDDPSIFVAFKVDKQKSKPKVDLGQKEGDLYLAIWTTTPWTLPANMAVAANPKAIYVRIRLGEKEFILAKDRLDAFSKQVGESLAVLGEFYGSQLDGLFYINPLESKVEKQKEFRKYHRILFSEDMVSMDEGTGLVHIAPGNGVEDYNLGIKNNVPVFSPINPDASYSSEAGAYSGITVPFDANKAVLKDLQELGALVKSGSIRHSYPHCWRCGSKLIFMATTQWFFNVQKMKKKLFKENEKTKWHPEEVKGWQNAVLSNSPDWTVSRQRYWGIPMPIWKCANGHMAIIGSLDELRHMAQNAAEVDALNDLHRPYVDKIALNCKECGNAMARIPDVFDVWFDSSCAFQASLTNGQRGKFIPAELIVEYVEQIRGWFQYMLKLGTMVYGRRPFNNVVVHGILFGNDGKKMSKSLGNFRQLSEMTRVFTADAFRLWCLNYNPILNRNLNDAEIRENEKVVTILRNVSNLLSEY
ncbi:MAG: isoleucine--tRNA ligase, partial [Candidatus Micrarchaeaceae archaeon]